MGGKPATTDAAVRPETAVDDTGRLLAEIPCIRCEYNLRGAEAEGRCPECGLAVGRSTRGHWLRYCEPTWVRTVWVGYNYLALIIVGIGGFIALMHYEFVDAVERHIGDTLALFVPVAILCSGVVLGLFGVWRIGTPDPDRVVEEPMLSKRRLARVSPFIMAGAWGVVVLVVPGMERHGGGGAFIGGMSVLVPMIVPVLTLWYAQSLAVRIPAVWLRRATWVVLALLIGAALLLHAAIVDYFEWTRHAYEAWRGLTGQPTGAIRSHYRGWALQERFVFGGMTAYAGALALTVLLLVWYWRAMKKQADLARQTWASVEKP